MYRNIYTYPWPVTFSNDMTPDSKVRGANMGPIWVLPAPDGPHDGLVILAISVYTLTYTAGHGGGMFTYLDVSWNVLQGWYTFTYFRYAKQFSMFVENKCIV